MVADLGRGSSVAASEILVVDDGGLPPADVTAEETRERWRAALVERAGLETKVGQAIKFGGTVG